MSILRLARGRNRALGVAAAGTAMVLAFVAAPSANALTGTWAVGNGNSGKCLEVNGWAGGNGARVDQWDCVNDGSGYLQQNEQWRLNYTSAGTYQIQSVSSGKCLEIQGWSTANGATLDQWDCLYTNGVPNRNQQWYRSSAGQFVNINSGKCLDVLGWSGGNGATVTQWDCGYDGNGSPQANQVWLLAQIVAPA